jgi:hypothetical protein
MKLGPVCISWRIIKGMGMISDGLEVMKLANVAANADLYEKLAKFVEKAQELQAKVESLEASNKELQEQLRFKGRIIRIWKCTYVDGDEEPICQRCAEVDGIPVHFIESRVGSLGDRFFCPQCKTRSGNQFPRSQAERLALEGR